MTKINNLVGLLLFAVVGFNVMLLFYQQFTILTGPNKLIVTNILMIAIICIGYYVVNFELEGGEQ